MTNERTRVLVMGNSNMSTLHRELEKTIEDTVVFGYNLFNILAENFEMEWFISGFKLRKSDIMVLRGPGQ